MVVFVDYDNDTGGKQTVLKSPDAFQQPYVDPGKLGISRLSVGFELPSSENPSAEAPRGALSSSENELQNSTIRNAFSVALGCYPYELLLNQATGVPGS
jgi:hypothetical protein